MNKRWLTVAGGLLTRKMETRLALGLALLDLRDERQESSIQEPE